MNKNNVKQNSWFDNDCKLLRDRAIKTPNDNKATAKYRQFAQSKKRNFKVDNREKLANTVATEPSKVLSDREEL